MNKLDTTTAVQYLQAKQMFSVSRTSLLTTVLLASILVSMQREVIGSTVVFGWFALIVLVTIFRTILVNTYQHSPLNDYSATPYWLRQFRIGVLLSGVIWGAAGFLLFPEGHPQHQMFLIFTLAGLTAGGLVSYSADLVSANVFSISVLAPLMLRLCIAGDSMSMAMGAATLLYLGFMVVSVKYIHRQISENIQLRLEAVNREDAVRASEERYRLLLRHSPVGILHYDTHLVITYCNERLAEILNNSIDGLIGLDMKILKDRSIIPALTQALSGEIGYYEGSYVATRSNKNGWIEMTCAPSRDASGQIAGGIAIVHDITERRQTELRVAYSESLYHGLFENMNSCVAVYVAVDEGEDFIFKDFNRAAESLEKLQRADVLGKRLTHCFPGVKEFGLLAVLQRVWKTGAPEHFPVSVYRDNRISGWRDNHIYRLPSGEVVAVYDDITASKQAEEEIKNLAFFDPLTQLPNRRLLMDRLKQALASSARNERQGALLIIDLDNFKTLNDTLGHDIGDMLLQQVAQRLASCVREDDTVARLGGDEFVVILESLSEKPLEAAAQTEFVGEKIIAALNRPYQLAAYEHRSTPSIGATLFNGRHQATDELLKQADIAMYQAKKSGRNALRFFDPKMQQTVTARAELEEALHNALAHQQFQLHYQIQVDNLHRPLGAEALIRWIHPERGLVPPLQFIPLAEEIGLILPIGKWVIETACAQIKTWQLDERTRDFVLAVNVSAKQFHQADFIAQVQSAVQRHAINPRLLKLELTESMLIEDIEDTIATMSALKETGVQFSLDDFGTGYSSLQYLKRLPLDQLKIDQSFVRDIVSDSSDRAIIRTIVAMANSLNLDIIAEGVETEEQRQLLLDTGCTHFQGYLFSKPVPIAQMMTLLRR